MPLHEGNKKGSAPAATVLTIKRVFEAPREQVWKAWSEPERMKLWWAPKPFTAPVIKIDFRVGGRFLGDMRTPEGKDIWSTGVYREITPLERIVVTDSFADENGNAVPATRYGLGADFPLELLVTLTFHERGGKTAVTLKHEGLPAGYELEQARKGWMESLDKLAEILNPEATAEVPPETTFLAAVGSQDVVATRFFAAPPASVFRVLTDPSLLPRWWGPRVLTTSVVAMDVRPGGFFRFVQRNPAGQEFAFHGYYHVVDAPSKIVSTFEFEGTPGHVSLEVRTLQEQAGGALLTDQTIFESVAERDQKVAWNMEAGVRASMDRLAELLREDPVKEG
jgi:uncharacterized protein YndB with AHSA1/START domain